MKYLEICITQVEKNLIFLKSYCLNFQFISLSAKNWFSQQTHKQMFFIYSRFSEMTATNWILLVQADADTPDLLSKHTGLNWYRHTSTSWQVARRLKLQPSLNPSNSSPQCPPRESRRESAWPSVGAHHNNYWNYWLDLRAIDMCANHVRSYTLLKEKKVGLLNVHKLSWIWRGKKSDFHFISPLFKAKLRH